MRGLRKKYPHASVHLLLNRQFASVEGLLGGLVDQYHYFEREALQQGLGEAQFNILWSYKKLDNLIQELNGNDFDIAYNFTHNKLSAFLLGALSIKSVRGLCFKDGQFEGIDNPWIKYFNERFSSNNRSVFHYIENLSHAFELPLDNRVEMIKRKSKVVLFQCLTSDPKKNWTLSSFKLLKDEIEKNLVDYKVKVLAAPFEVDLLTRVFSPDDILVCDLNQALVHLKSAALLVTGDTSIKHLAAQEGTPLVELVLGSSDVVKTGAYSLGAYQVQTKAPCAPCVHSVACSQKSHVCAESLTVEDVFVQVWNALSGQAPQKNITSVLDKKVWELYLNGKRSIDEIAIDSSDLKAAEFQAWKEETTYFTRLQAQFEMELPSRESFLSRKKLSSSDLASFISLAQEVVRKKTDHAGYFQNVFEALLARFVQPVEIWDRLSTALKHSRELLILRNLVLQKLETHSKDGGYYAKGIGHLSDRSFEEAGQSVQRDFQDSAV